MKESVGTKAKSPSLNGRILAYLTNHPAGRTTREIARDLTGDPGSEQVLNAVGRLRMGVRIRPAAQPWAPCAVTGGNHTRWVPVRRAVD